MGDKTYDIVMYEPQYKEELLDLMEPLWGTDRNRNSMYLDWKYCRNPYTTTPLIYLTLYQKKIVSVAGFFAARWQAGQRGDEYLCFSGGDAVTKVDHRRQGLHDAMKYRAFEKLKKDAFSFEISLATNSLSAGSALKWARSVGELGIMEWRGGKNGNNNLLRQTVRQLPLLPSLYRFYQSAVVRDVHSPTQKTSGVFHVLDDNYESIQRFKHLGISVDQKPRPDAMAALVRTSKNEGRIRQVRDEEFYAWRFDNPFSVFRFLFCEKGGFQGFIVLQQSVRDPHTALIVDWESTSSEIFSDLLDVVIRWGGLSSIAIWSATLSEETTEILKKKGFHTPDAYGQQDSKVFYPPIAIYPLDSGSVWSMGSKSVMEITNWDMRPIYSDNY
ncbi:MAG TPA: hypothetical protein VGJ94_07535 [Syntrophorhabdaceae bacterium]|jgi:hypothetical protein